jgi:hypothetical protein
MLQSPHFPAITRLKVIRKNLSVGMMRGSKCAHLTLLREANTDVSRHRQDWIVEKPL